MASSSTPSVASILLVSLRKSTLLTQSGSWQERGQGIERDRDGSRGVWPQAVGGGGPGAPPPQPGEHPGGAGGELGCVGVGEHGQPATPIPLHLPPVGGGNLCQTWPEALSTGATGRVERVPELPGQGEGPPPTPSSTSRRQRRSPHRPSVSPTPAPASHACTSFTRAWGPLRVNVGTTDVSTHVCVQDLRPQPPMHPWKGALPLSLTHHVQGSGYQHARAPRISLLLQP